MSTRLSTVIWRGTIAVLLICLVQSLGRTHVVAKSAFGPPTWETARVTGVTDGDTITVALSNGTTAKLRYIGIDTPETGQPWAKEATAANTSLVMGQNVVLVKDKSDKDTFGRLLRYVFLPSGVFINLELVKKGMAEAVAYPPNTARQSELEEAESLAISQRIGRWANVPTATQTANLRAGPGTAFALKGSVKAGQPLSIVGRNAEGDWLQIAGGAWIAGFLISNVPASVPVARNIPPVPVAPASRVVTPAPTAVPQRSAPGIIPVQAACDCSGPDLDCKDFGTHDEAQACHDYCTRTVGYDIFRLDGSDNDGLACESLP